MRGLARFQCTVACWLFAPWVAAQEPEPAPKARPPLRQFAISSAAAEIRVDGRLEEPGWQTAAVIDLPYEWQPGENIEPPVATECLVAYDAKNLYVGFRAHDPEPGKIRAHLMDRDQIDTLIQDDYVGFMLDPFNDQRRAFQFRINPLGVQAEALNTSGNEDWEWDIIWASAGRITETGYEVEVAVPFSQLRFPAGGDELTFGFQGMRSWPRSVRHRIASDFTDFADACMFCQLGRIVGFRGIGVGRNLELDPTLTASRTDQRSEPSGGPLEVGDLEVDPGLSLRWGISSSLTLNGAVNPDFSQVEADIAQLEVNERFALFYPEKRPFFLEGVDYFQTPIQAVFTRTVADPSFGGKLTGKQGANAFGIFVTRDRLSNLLIPSNQTSGLDSLGDETTTGILRYRRDVGRSSSVGVLYTGREAADYHNRAAGVDGAFQVASADVVRFQYLRSDTLYPEPVAVRQEQVSDAFGGSGLDVEYNHFTRYWNWTAEYQDLDPGFRADSGFVPRVDVRTGELFFARTWWGGRENWWNSLNLGIDLERTEDHDGRLTDQSIELRGQVQGPLQSSLFVEASRSKEFFGGETFELDSVVFDLEMQPSGMMKLGLLGIFGDAIDTYNTRKGELLNLGPRVELKLGRHLNLNLAHSYQRLEVPGGRLFRENLSEVRLVYHLNVRTFARAILQYRDVERDPDLFEAPVSAESRRLFVQFLASYKLNPQTVVFLGYSDNHQGLPGADLARADRTFFVKLGYAWTT